MEFVTFEIAKKLKEKGFREKCLSYYDEEDNVGLLYNIQYTDESLPCQYTDLLQCHNTGEAEYQIDDSGFCVDTPTISQALKWLRENYATHLEISLGRNAWYFATTNYEYHEEEKVYDFTTTHVSDSWDSYEEAALAGIEYTLDNLI